jgi:hypothetical protein
MTVGNHLAFSSNKPQEANKPVSAKRATDFL